VTAAVSEDDLPDVNPPPPTTADGVRMERVRPGRTDEALFLIPGLDGDPTELAGLVAGFAGPQEVWAVSPGRDDGGPRNRGASPPIATMQLMAAQMVAAVRRQQPSGPYRLGGFSFGGLLALEMAQQLRADGNTVDELFLIEAVYDERYWPRTIWLRALVVRTSRHVLRIARMRPMRAIGEIRLRSGRLLHRITRRSAGAPDRLNGGTADQMTAAAARAYVAIAGYRPRHYDGRITLIASSIDQHFGCDTANLWTGYADRIDVQRIDGDHLTVMHERAAAAAVAGVIDHRLALRREDWTGLRPVPGFARPMILTTMRWFSAARLAHAMTEAGFAVSACRPGAHPIELVDGLTTDFRLARRGRLRSLSDAIRQADPDIILPDDERALALLRKLHARTATTDPALARLIVRSLGAVEDWPAIASRTAVSSQARALGIASPATDVIDSADSLERWAAGRERPIVLKTDGSWGGRGVAIVAAGLPLREAWRRMSRPAGLPRAVKRLAVDRDAGSLMAWVRRDRPVVNVQQYIGGREAIVTAACIDGRVQALACLDVLRSSGPKANAAVVRIVDHPEMAAAARQLINRFGLSGFCGLDFIVTPDGEAHLIEMNARITPTCHLLVEGDVQPGRTIALFPATHSDIDPAAAVVMDRPIRSPALIRHGAAIIARHHRPMARTARRLKQRVIRPRY
jgi:thioesterase domain-containing protein